MTRLFIVFLMLTSVSVAGAQQPDLQSAMAAYIGEWASDEKTREDGTTHRFHYSLQPFDQSGQIVEMTIRMIDESGTETLLWRGFKGWDAVREVGYYHAASPSGRFADGHVFLSDNGELVTEYRGVDPVQGENQIRDMFTPVTDGQFSSTTYIRRDGDWVEILHDTWTSTG
jgi:hypothetical protein